MQVGTKLNLKINGKERQYKVIEVRNNEVKLFNKYVISFWMPINEVLLCEVV